MIRMSGMGPSNLSKPDTDNFRPSAQRSTTKIMYITPAPQHSRNPENARSTIVLQTFERRLNAHPSTAGSNRTVLLMPLLNGTAGDRVRVCRLHKRGRIEWRISPVSLPVRLQRVSAQLWEKPQPDYRSGQDEFPGARRFAERMKMATMSAHGSIIAANSQYCSGKHETLGR